jgi:hypothetical protein
VQLHCPSLHAQVPQPAGFGTPLLPEGNSWNSTSQDAPDPAEVEAEVEVSELPLLDAPDAPVVTAPAVEPPLEGLAPVVVLPDVSLLPALELAAPVPPLPSVVTLSRGRQNPAWQAYGSPSGRQSASASHGTSQTATSPASMLASVHTAPLLKSAQLDSATRQLRVHRP